MYKSVYKIIELMISEDEEAMLESISLVDKPAIERDFMYFSKQEARQYIFEEEGEQRIVIGPAMIPDMKIPRMEDGEIYYVYFKKETIARAAELFLKYNRASAQNTDHKDNFNNEVYVMESWIIEDDKDKTFTKYGFSELPLGTWMVKIRVNDDKIWKEVKEGKYKGFSVQGDFILGQEKYEKAFAAYKRKYKNVRSKWKKLYKGLTQEEKMQLDEILFLVEMEEFDVFETPEGAIRRSKELGLMGEIHSHYDEELKGLIYMPGATHEDYENAIANLEAKQEEMEGLDVSGLPNYINEGATGEVNNLTISQQGFVSVSPGESKDDYIGRCMSSLQGEYPSEDQRYAVCITEWEGSAQEFQSYTDYPEGASNNAKRALDWKEKNGSDCGTAIGWTRARQLANREPISEETIARMASFERHRQNSETPYTEGCGGIMWDAWGGDSGIRWAQTKLREIRGEEFRMYTTLERRIISDFLRDVANQFGVRYFAAVEDLAVGDSVSWTTGGQNPRGKIVEIVREGSKKVPGADFEISGTPDNPGYLIRVYEQNAEGNWTPTETLVGRKADSLLKNVDPL